MFLILRRTATEAPRRIVVAAGSGVTDISASVQVPADGAVTFVSVGSPGVPSSVPSPGSLPTAGRVPVPLAVRSPGSGSDGLPAPGPGSEKDGSSSGTAVAEGEVIGVGEEALLPRLLFLSSPPEQDTNSTMTPSSSAPSTTARRRQYTAAGRGPTVERMMGARYPRCGGTAAATRRERDTVSDVDR